MDGRQLELGSTAEGKQSGCQAASREEVSGRKSQSARLKEGVEEPVFAAGKDPSADIVPFVS